MTKIFVDILTLIGALVIAISTFLLLENNSSPQPIQPVSRLQNSFEQPTTTIESPVASSSTTITTNRKEFLGTSPTTQTPKKSVKEPSQETDKIPTVTAAKQPDPQETSLTEAPPSSKSTLDATTLNTLTRAALVNILCESSNPRLKSTSGSGIIVDSRGIILTNAHIAQHMLLAEHPNIPLSCIVRTGSPARATWNARLLYIPPQWVAEHGADIVKLHATGTGEDDYALLLITGTTGGSALPSSFPFIEIDTDEGTVMTGDTVFVAAYPAEFAGSSATRQQLYASAATSKIQEVLTFESGTIDVLSFGATPVAQSGSSGGPAVSLLGKLVSIIVTTSEGETTGMRDLRGITLAHINRSIRNESGMSLTTLLEKDPQSLISLFESSRLSSQKTLINYTGLEL